MREPGARAARLFSLKWILFLALLVLQVPSSHGQITILGKDSRDKWLSSFFAQQNNVPVMIIGMNANAGGNTLSDVLMPPRLGPKILDGANGLFTGTNRFAIQTWDTNNAAFQTFEFTLNGSLPVTSNAVSRIAFPETNTFKVMNNWRFQTNGTFQTGVPVAMGTSYGKTVQGMSGVNRINVLHTYETGGTRYMEWTDGVFTNAQ